MKLKLWIVCLFLSLGHAVAQVNVVAVSNDEEKPARSDKWKHYILGGFNFGALTPLSMPNTVRKVEAWWPGFSPSVGYGILYSMDSHWGISAAVKVDYKGMGVKDSVQYFHTMITIEDGTQTGEFEGDFTGTNKTIVHNAYLTFPVNIVYQPCKIWRYNLGIYASWLFNPGFSGTVTDGYIRKGNSLGEKVFIDKASFNFDKEERKFDWGLQAGVERELGHKLALNSNLSWGLCPVFPAEFKGVALNMYNIFLNIGLSYEL